ncbi:MAG: tRNA pseudouridine(13) synthase TruD [Leptospirales bacterium]|nr:tRNA pseudouridine(13) synthase TruD [Leptospirales bacterium]
MNDSLAGDFATQRVLPLVSANLPGIGGQFKAHPEDFVVEELPLYDACGEGEHIYLRLRRRLLNTRELVGMLARELSISEASIGYAGLKDRRALSEQTFSLHMPRVALQSVVDRIAARLPSLQVLAANRHRNKLRVGHLRGNRFRLQLRELHPQWMPRLQAKLAFLDSVGTPNYFGEQRFGAEGDNAGRGLAILQGRQKARGWMRRFMLSALQSDLFNRWLASRLQMLCYPQLLAGDVARKRQSGGIFVVQDPELENQRRLRGEIDLCGPIFGQKMPAAEGRPAQMEKAVLDSAGLGFRDFDRSELPGSRRPAIMPIAALQWHAAPNDLHRLEMQFELPPGCYATVLLSELQHGNEPAPGTDATATDATV